MAILQTTGATTSNGSATSTLAFAPIYINAAQNIVVAVALADTSQTVTGIADTAGNTFTVRSAVNGTGVRTEVWEAQQTAYHATDIITITFSGATLAAAAFEQYSGIVSQSYISFSSDLGPHNMTTDSLPSPLVASASSAYGGRPAWHAFDGNITGGEGSEWLTTAQTGYLQIDLGSGNGIQVSGYGITITNSAWGPARAPKDWTFLGSNDGSSWTTLDTKVSQTGWIANERRNFALAGGLSSSYRYFKLDVTADNGDTNNMGILEFSLLAGISPPMSVQNTGTNTGNDTQPRGNVAIQEQTNWTVAALGFACQSGDTFTATDGTIRQQVVPALTSVGVALLEVIGLKYIASLYSSARLNTTRQWAMAGFELRGGGTTANNPSDYVGALPVNGNPLTKDFRYKMTMPSLEGTGVVGAPNWGAWIFNNGLIAAYYYETWQLVTPAGSTACTYAITSGALPSGLSFAQSSGVGTISGTPTTTGTFSFTMSATNTWGTTSKAFSIQINSASGVVVSIMF